MQPRFTTYLAMAPCAMEELRAHLEEVGDANMFIDGTSLLYGAARSGQAKAVHLLLEAGAQQSLLDPSPTRGRYPLHAAALAQAPTCVSLLLDGHMAMERDFDPSKLTSCFSETPMVCALLQPFTACHLLHHVDSCVPMRAPLCIPSPAIAVRLGRGGMRSRGGGWVKDGGPQGGGGGSANTETTPARAPAGAADRKQHSDATCEGKNG